MPGRSTEAILENGHVAVGGLQVQFGQVVKVFDGARGETLHDSDSVHTYKNSRSRQRSPDIRKPAAA